MPISTEQARKNGLKGGRPKSLEVTKRELSESNRQLARKKIISRITIFADKLVNSQMIVALGTHKMIIVKKDAVTGEVHVETVRDEERMQSFLDTGVYGKDYLIVAGAEPDWKAANALLDRAFGKAVESVDLTSGGEKIGEMKYIVPAGAPVRDAEFKSPETIAAPVEEIVAPEPEKVEEDIAVSINFEEKK